MSRWAIIGALVQYAPEWMEDPNGGWMYEGEAAYGCALFSAAVKRAAKRGGMLAG